MAIVGSFLQDVVILVGLAALAFVAKALSFKLSLRFWITLSGLSEHLSHEANFQHHVHAWDPVYSLCFCVCARTHYPVSISSRPTPRQNPFLLEISSIVLYRAYGKRQRSRSVAT